MAVNTTPIRKRGRPAGTRAKKLAKEWGLEEYKEAYQNMLNVRNAAKDEIINLSVELNRKDEQIKELTNKVNRYAAIEHHAKNLEMTIRAKEIRETKLFGIVEYLEDKVKSLINA